MVTCVLAETTKVKNNFSNGKKKFKRILICVFGGRQKGQVKNLPSRTSSLVSGGSATNSVGTTLKFTEFVSGPDVKPSRASAFWFFLSTTMVFAAVLTHFPKKNTRVYRNTETCVTRITSNRVAVHRWNSQHLAMVRTSHIAELVPPRIFCVQPWSLQRSEHISPRKTPVYMSIELCDQ